MICGLMCNTFIAELVRVSGTIKFTLLWSAIPECLFRPLLCPIIYGWSFCECRLGRKQLFGSMVQEISNMSSS